MVAEFLSGLSHRGVSVWVEAGRIAVRPAERLSAADREVLRRERSALLAYLSAPATEPWNLAVALHLMDQADGAVEDSGVSGTHPEIQAVATAVCAAYAEKNLGGVRSACQAMSETVRRLTGT